MKTISRILGPNGEPLKLSRPRENSPRSLESNQREITARYDAALWSHENSKSWSLVDGMSARAANSKDVRTRLRTRARYEVANNSYARGIINTLANDCIGTGPRLQLMTADPKVNQAVERSFMEWSRSIHLAAKLRTMRMALAQDGESFGLFITNPMLPTEVQLDMLLIEADQVSTPFLNPIDPLAVDGIRFDLEGNPVLYSLLRRHPGDTYQIGLLADYVDARHMIHWFRTDRPGQRRGLPDIMPALELFNQLRRYTLAVLAAAETAADHAAVLYSELPPDDGATDCEPFEHLDIERRMMTTLPMGWKMGQFKAEQPTTTYEMFKKEILKEIARCLNVPYNVASGDSSNYNYASGRLDHQTYHKSIHVDQSTIELVILDRIFMAWLEEASLTPGLISVVNEESLYPGQWPHQWFWDGYEHVDPLKEAQAQEKRLQSNTTTLAAEYARRGQDWEPHIRQRAKEIALMISLGVPIGLPPGSLPPGPDLEPVGNTDDDEGDANPQEAD